MNYNLNKFINNKDDIGCGTYLCIVFFAIALVFGMSCLYACVGMLLWNWVIVGELGLFAEKIGFWHMWGIVELCSILFKTHNYNSNNNK